MQKNIGTLLFIIIVMVFSNFNLVGQDENLQPPFTQEDVPTIPEFLQQKRKEDAQFIQGFIEELQGKRGAIRKVEDEMIRTYDNNVYNEEVKYCYMPATIEWFAWFYRLFSWDKNYSKVETDIKNLHDLQQKKHAEIKDLSRQYAHYTDKAEDVIKRTSKQLEWKYKNKRGQLYRIGKQGENGVELLSNPDISCLKLQQKDLKLALILKALKCFHNEKIPLTQQEVELILATRASFAKYIVKLENVLKNFNMLVTEYEEKNKKEKEMFNKNNEN